MGILNYTHQFSENSVILTTIPYLASFLKVGLKALIQ